MILNVPGNQVYNLQLAIESRENDDKSMELGAHPISERAYGKPNKKPKSIWS